MTGLRVLIIEDEPLIAVLFEDALKELGHSVTGKAATVEEALNLVKQSDFDIAILDVMLRRVASHPVAALLRTLGRPFIVTSGFNQGMLDGDFIGAPVLSKPFTIEQLADLLSLVAPRDQSS